MTTPGGGRGGPLDDPQASGGATTATLESALAPTAPARRWGAAGVFRHLASNPLTAAGAVVAIVLVLVALAAPLIAPHDPIAVDLPHRLRAPSSRFWFGTDEEGRDIFSRVVYGTRISLSAAAGILLIAVVVGVTVGLVAGYAGGWVDEVLMRVTDMFLAFPSLVLAMGVAATLGASLINGVVAIGVVWWPWYARLVRGQVLRLKQEAFVEAARVAGATGRQIVLTHIVRNAMTPIVVQMSLDVGYAILTMASLSFIGLGAQPPTPEWGAMISVGRDYYLNQWWYVTFPGLAIFLAVMAFNFLGDGLQEALSPETAR
jgi:peptide/nickel transport system permease protein